MDRSAVGNLHGFPAALTSFVGRAAAVQEVVVTKGNPGEILKKYQDEYNGSYGGE